MSYVRDFLVLFSVFVRKNVTITEKITFADSVSGIRPPYCSKLAKNQKNDNDVTISRHDINVKFFWRCFVSLFNFRYWSKFHVNIINGSGIITIFVYMGLTRNPEIGNTPVWVLSNIWRLGQVMDTEFGTNVCKRMLLNAVKFQGHSFYRFWVIKGKSAGGEGKINPSSTQIWVKTKIWLQNLTWLLFNFISRKSLCFCVERRRMKIIKRKHRQIVALSILNCPLIILSMFRFNKQISKVQQ